MTIKQRWRFMRSFCKVLFYNKVGKLNIYTNIWVFKSNTTSFEQEKCYK